MKRLLLVLMCLGCGACIDFEDVPESSEETGAPTPVALPTPDVVFFDTFETTAADWQLVNASTTSGMLSGTATGSIGGGSLVQSATGAIGSPPGNGPAGIFEATLLREVPLTAGDYSIHLIHTATPPGSALSSNHLLVNGTSHFLLATELEYRIIPFTMTSNADLALVFRSASGDDSGMVLTANLEVTEIRVTRDD